MTEPERRLYRVWFLGGNYADVEAASPEVAGRGPWNPSFGPIAEIVDYGPTPTPDVKGAQPERLVERFWERIERTDSCWLWRGSITGSGYGSFRLGGRAQAAHRIAYELMIGPIPEGLTLDHLCRVRNCVNPAHLEPVTSTENILRGEGPTALNARKTHCPQGHEYTPENTRTYKDRPGRDCLTCHREWSRRYMLRRRRLAREAQRGVALAVKEML